jgi:hypothetical protein
VRRVTHDENVRGTETYARSKRVERAASSRRFGVVVAAMRSARSESAARMSTLGRWPPGLPVDAVEGGLGVAGAPGVAALCAAPTPGGDGASD